MLLCCVQSGHYEADSFPVFQDTMALVWQLAMGVTMRQLQAQRFLVRFYHEADITRVLTDGPWTYEQCLLIMQRVQSGEDPEQVVLQHADFWIQIHSLPVGFRSEVVVSAIGSFLGTLVCTDEKNFDGGMRTFYRVRVALDVSKPLKKQMKLKRENGTWALIDFRYERLPTFCFLCGVIGHGERVCPKIIQGVDRKAEKPFGVWLRAGGRRATPLSGQRWVAPESDADRQNWTSPAMEANVAVRQSDSIIPSPGHTVGAIPAVLVGEQKRKRTEGMSELSTEDSQMECEAVVPKNLLEAGIAMQTRLDL